MNETTKQPKTVERSKEAPFAGPFCSATWRLIGAGKKLHAFKGDETMYAICGIGGKTSGPCDKPEEWPRCKVCVGLLPNDQAVATASKQHPQT